MAVKTITKFSGNIVTGAAAPGLPSLYSGKWSRQIKGSVDEIIGGLNRTVPDALSYQDQVVSKSVAKFAPVINPGFVSKKGANAASIIANHATKLTTSYDKYKVGRDKAFGTVDGVPGKNFKDAVDAGESNWERNVAAYSLPFTGSNASGKGPMIFIQEFLTGDLNSAKTLPAGWTADSACNIIEPGMENNFKPMVCGLLTQVMSQAAKANFTPAVLEGANAKLVKALNALLNTAVANRFAAPDASPNSSLILSAGEAEGILHVECIVRMG